MVNEQIQPYEDIVTGQVYVTSANANYQLMFAPYPTPTGRKLYLRKLIISNALGTAGELRLWDQDLTGSGIASRGSGAQNGCLMLLGYPTATLSGVSTSTTIFEPSQLPIRAFETGIAVLATQLNCMVMAEAAVV